MAASASFRFSGLTLAGATAVNGLAAYAFVVAGTRLLGSEGFAPTAVLWTVWTICISAITLPFQQWIVASGCNVRAIPRTRLVMWSAVATVGGVAVYTFSDLSVDSSRLQLLCFASVGPLCVALGRSRGALASGKAWDRLAVSIGAENLVRVGVLVALASWRDADPSSGLVAVLAGFVVICLRNRPDRQQPDRSIAVVHHSVGWTTSAVALAQVIPALPILVLAGIEVDHASTSTVFVLLSTFRAPQLIMVGIAPLLITYADQVARYARSLAGLIVGIVAVMGIGALLGAFLGPLAITNLFRLTSTLSWQVCALLGAGMALAALTFAYSQVLLANGDPRRISLAFGIGVVVFATAILLPTEPTARVAVALLLAEIGVSVSLVNLCRHPPKRTILYEFRRPCTSHQCD